MTLPTKKLLNKVKIATSRHFRYTRVAFLYNVHNSIVLGGSEVDGCTTSLFTNFAISMFVIISGVGWAVVPSKSRHLSQRDIEYLEYLQMP